jgi:antitoxin component YwqK of YwqJK toxin-antitoxin module
MRSKSLLLAGVAMLSVAALLAVRAWLKPPREVMRAELDLRAGMLYLHDSKKPFTGLLVEDYPKGARKVAIEIHRGKVDGLSRGWFENGQEEVEEHFTAGVSQGLRTRWHANGQRKSEEHIEHGKLEGSYLEWHANGRKAVEMTLRAGQADGLVQAWHRSGAPKSRVQMKRGQVVEREFFEDALAARTP